jgi:hypothetical protein
MHAARHARPGRHGGSRATHTRTLTFAMRICLIALTLSLRHRTRIGTTQGRVVEATWKGRPVAVKIMSEAFPRHMLGRKGSGNLEAMMENLEGAQSAGGLPCRTMCA